MTTAISEIIGNNQLPIDSDRKIGSNKIPIESVDKLADELASAYLNTKYRSWYCKVIYEFGIAQVLEWQRRASEGRDPARLFSKYAKSAFDSRGLRRS